MRFAVPVPVPATYSEITAAWLTEALAETGVLTAGRVTRVRLSQIGLGRGFIGLTLRLNARYSDDAAGGPRSMVVKLPSVVELADPQMRMFTNLLYKNEIAFYRSLAAEAPVRVPKAYWSGEDDASGRYCLLLEDLSGLAQSSQREGATVEQARLAASNLARLHARWWGAGELARQTWMIPTEMTMGLMAGLAQAGWPIYWPLVGEKLPPAFEAVGTKLVAQLYGVAAAAAARSKTLVHGDYRLENFLFGEAGSADELVVLDWQLVGSMSGAYDLAYFLSQSLDIEIRRGCEQEILDLYHHGLVAGGVSGYSREMLDLDYRANLLAAMVVAINGAKSYADVSVDGGGAGLSGSDRADVQTALAAGLELVHVMGQRGVAAIFDNHAEELLA